MGLYTYLTEQEQIKWRQVSHPDIRELFEEALKIDKSLMISEHCIEVSGGWFKRIWEMRFYVYHEVFLENGKSAMEARQQMSASGPKEVCIAYLHGIINGQKQIRREELQSGIAIKLFLLAKNMPLLEFKKELAKRYSIAIIDDQQ